MISITVSFFSYFKELTSCSQFKTIVPEGSTLRDVFEHIAQRFPKLAVMEKSTLMAVGLDYQDRNYILKNGEEVSLFPPVQGG